MTNGLSSVIDERAGTITVSYEGAQLQEPLSQAISDAANAHGLNASDVTAMFSHVTTDEASMSAISLASPPEAGSDTSVLLGGSPAKVKPEEIPDRLRWLG